MARKVLVIDDEQGIRNALEQLLDYEGIEVRTADSGLSGIKQYSDFSPNLVFLDVKMAGLDGLTTLEEILKLDPAAQVIMISGHGTIQTALDATRIGAYDFLEKPLDTDRILLTLKRAFEKFDLASENSRLRSHIEDRYRMVGSSKALSNVQEIIEKVAPTHSRVLITGANGSGKELVARAIHANSPRADRPFVEVNCAAIPGELIESELFGHMKGSFTGAVQDRPGKFEQADGGTLFLDEIGDMSEAAQSKVLRALQEGAITRVGGSQPIEVDVRVLAATNKPIQKEIEAGRFREDLYYRLNVVPIEVPPLDSRKDDIPLLVEHFVSELRASSGLAGKTFDEEAIEALRRREWRGNVRELRNAVERMLIMSSGATVTIADVNGLGGGATGGLFESAGNPSTFETFKQEAEKSFLTAKLQEFSWNVSETARALEMPRSNLYKKIDKYGLSRKD
jgi:two-component system nitrogen regulation response regulator NtrX